MNIFSKSAIIRLFHRCGLYFLGLSIAFIVSTATMVLGQQTLEVPVPQTQGTQPLTPRARPAPSIVPRSNNVQTIPTAPPAQLPSVQAQPEPEAEQPPPPPQPSLPLPPPPPVVRQPEPVLPAVFRGCWRGRVEEVDRMQRLPGGPHLGLWMPKTYLLCYRRVGNGPFKLTFTEAGVEGTSRITNTTGQLRVVSTDGNSYATMRAFLHFDEFLPGLFGPSTFAVDEETDLQCTIGPDGMHASGVVYGERNGAPWFRAWWHTTFFHESGLPD